MEKNGGNKGQLIHDYFGIDYDIVWNIIVNKLPDLRDFIDHIFNF